MGVPKDPAAEASEAILRLWMAGKPVFPRVAAEFDLTPPELHMVRLLEEGESLPMGALAGMLYCDASYVTAIVDKLEQRGVIERTPDPSDRRVKRISLTRDGLELRKAALARLYEPPEAIRKLPKSDQRTLRDIMRRALSLQMV